MTQYCFQLLTPYPTLLPLSIWSNDNVNQTMTLCRWVVINCASWKEETSRHLWKETCGWGDGSVAHKHEDPSSGPQDPHNAGHSKVGDRDKSPATYCPTILCRWWWRGEILSQTKQNLGTNTQGCPTTAPCTPHVCLCSYTQACICTYKYMHHIHT